MEKQSQRINKPREFTGKYPAIITTTAACGVAQQNELKATESEWSVEKEHASAMKVVILNWHMASDREGQDGERGSGKETATSAVEFSQLSHAPNEVITRRHERIRNA